MDEKKLFKLEPGNIIYWVDNHDEFKGELIFTFDKIEYFNFYRDYPRKLTPEQKRIFDKENPYLAKLKSPK